MGYIYLITNTINGKKYVGQTQQDDIKTRWSAHKKLNQNVIGRYLLNAYKKHGINNFKFQIICVCFDDACNELEKYYIEKYNCLVPNGYNLMSGGGNFKHHPETIKKMRESLKGRLLGKRTQETYKKISDALKGEKNPNFGKKMSDEQKKKISEGRKKAIAKGDIIYKDLSEISDKQKEALRRGTESNKRKVGKYDLNNNLLNTYNSISEASVKENINRSNISAVCRGADKYKTAGGFVWKYHEVSQN
jgi:group I intron endonuclease